MEIYIWGTGRLVGQLFNKGIVRAEDVMGFIDNNGKSEHLGKQVIRPIELIEKNYDAVLIANVYSEEIKKQCKEIGIDLKKVIFLYNNYIKDDMNQDYKFIERILGNRYADTVRKRYHIIRDMEEYPSNFDTEIGYYKNDYVRMKTFELVVNELKNKWGG